VSSEAITSVETLVPISIATLGDATDPAASRASNFSARGLAGILGSCALKARDLRLAEAKAEQCFA
jgi:hypothetical protein